MIVFENKIAKVAKGDDGRSYLQRPNANAIWLFAPQEYGYRCPAGHANIYWSEWEEHIWCYKCEKDYHYANDCVLVKDKYNPKKLPMQPKIIKGVKNWKKDGNGWNDIPRKLIQRRK